VGFGDYAPRSDIERILIALSLLAGVSIQSYIMGNLIEILQDNKTLSASFDDSYELSKFFGLIKYLNKGQNLKIELED
jgi:hypothetical protein